MKKILSLMLTLVMMFSMCVAAFADNTYSITVTNSPDTTHVSINGKSYTAYKLFDMTTADPTFAEGDDTPVAYTIADEFKNFDYELKNSSNAVIDTIPADELPNYVSEFVNDNDEGLFAFGEAAKAYIDANGITGITKTAADEKVLFDNLEPGYYLIYGTSKPTEEGAADTDTVVAACMLTNTDPNPEIKVKVSAPTVEKVIVKDGEELKGTSEDYLGEYIQFKITTTVPDTTGYDEYVFKVHDHLSSGLSFCDFTVITIDGVEITKGSQPQNYGVVAETVSLVEGQDIHFEFNDISQFKAGAEVVITYNAVLSGFNGNHPLNTAVQTNTAKVEYSNDPYTESTGKTPEDIVYVYDFSIVIDKVADKPANKKLAGAEFVLRKKADDGSYLYYQHNLNNSNRTRWVSLSVPIENYFESGNFGPLRGSVTVVETNADGMASYDGLEAGTYELVEITAPDGYNLLEEPVEVVITAEYNEDGTLKSSSATIADDGQYKQTVQIKNTSGTLLPETGGIGTVIFYLIGGALVLGSVVLLVTKKRMSATK